MAEDTHVPPLPRRAPDDRRPMPGGKPGWGSGLTQPLVLPDSVQQRIRAALDTDEDEDSPPEHSAPLQQQDAPPQAAEAAGQQRASLPRRVPGANNGPAPPAHIARPAMLPALVHPRPAAPVPAVPAATLGAIAAAAGTPANVAARPEVTARPEAATQAPGGTAEAAPAGGRHPAGGCHPSTGRRPARAHHRRPARAHHHRARRAAGARPAAPCGAAAGPARSPGGGQRGPAARPAAHTHDAGGHVGVPRAGGGPDGAVPGHPGAQARRGDGEDRGTAGRCHPAWARRRPGG